MAPKSTPWHWLISPWSAERLSLLTARWQNLKDSLRQPNQSIGRQTVGCAATHGIHEACNFGCTACYLGKQANHQPPLAQSEVKDQLDRIREALGEGGNVQITSGEVTLLPVEHLIDYCRYAKSIGLSPMVMTHGDTFQQNPDYLKRLLRESGLRKLSIHVDSTQRGRQAMPKPSSEKALHPVRDALANLFRSVQKEQAIRLKLAHTLTIDPQNLDQIKDVIPWFLTNLDIFRLISFQPVAQTGRTRSAGGLSSQVVWERIESAFQRSLEPHAILFGHPDCTRLGLFAAILGAKKPLILEAVRKSNIMDKAFVAAVLRDFGGVVINERPLSEILLKCLGVLVQRPAWLGRIPLYFLRRSLQEYRNWGHVFKALFSFQFRIRLFAVVVHDFMDEATLLSEKGQERSANCAFQVPHQGEMVSMCRFNASGLRTESYAARQV
ncbi:MAG: radical SAM protein [Acidobacteria bacterium]|nr:radical SAM protein [Acidobacteriota bacterium]